MNAFSRIAENRIRAALEAGELDQLPGRGRPLVFDDDRFVPEDLRMAYHLLRNAGVLPPELELRNEVIRMATLYEAIDDDVERRRALRDLEFKLLRLREMRKGPVAFDRMPEYEARLYGRHLDGGARRR